MRAKLFWTVAFVGVIIAARSEAQWAGRDGWIEEPATQSSNAENKAAHAYLDSASMHRGDDGLIYFNESSDVMSPEQIGKIGLMNDAYDCAKNIKYICIGTGDWRHDRRSTIDTHGDAALAVYRK